MSDQLRLPGFGGQPPEYRPAPEAIRASIARELQYLLASSRETGRGFRITPTGLAHSVGVCLIEDWNMSRGKAKGQGGAVSGGMPRFVDVKLSAEDKEAFLAWLRDGIDPVRCLQVFADSGYRVGVAWSGEHQTYTVSVTCRDEQSENNGLCMTSFSRDLTQAIMLAWYKHDVMCAGFWSRFVPAPTDVFG